MYMFKILPDSHIRIERIRQKGLLDFWRSVQSAPAFANVRPITSMRAISQAKNPYAQPEDVVLLVAYQGEKCIGYHGLLPGRLVRGGQAEPVFWVTTFYVDPAFRGKGIGRMLLQEIQRLKIDFVTTQMTPSAEQAYRRAGYLDLGHLDYYQMRLDRLAFQQFRAASNAEPQTVAQRIFASFYHLRKKSFYDKMTHLTGSGSLVLNKVERISSIFKDSISTHNAAPAFHRGIEAINWMMMMPWVIAGNTSEGKAKNYYFTSSRDLFRYEATEILDPANNTPTGFVVLSASNKHGRSRIKILDHYYPSTTCRRLIVVVALINAARILADRVEFPAVFKEDFQKLTQKERLIKKQHRIYMYTPAHSESHLATAAGRITFDYCDGDTAFT